MESQSAETRVADQSSCPPHQAPPSTVEILEAASVGNTHFIRRAVSSLGDEIVTHVDEDGMSALHVAAQRGHFPVVKYLLEAGACPRSKPTASSLPPSDSYSSMPSISPSAASSDHHDASATSRPPHLSDSAEENFSPIDKSTASSTTGSSTTSSGDLAQRREGKIIDEPVRSPRQESPSLWASVKSNRGHTALHWAAIKGHVTIVTELVKAGFDVNDRSKLGATPLQLATAGERTEVVRFLVGCGADVSIRTKSGSSPLLVAQHLSNVELIEILERSRAPQRTTSSKAPPDTTTCVAADIVC